METRSTAMSDAARLSGEDLMFWWGDSPMQQSTMAMLMLLDRAPDEASLRFAFERAVAAVPRLSMRVVEAPLELTVPHWEFDPTFDLDYHLRRHALSGTADFEELLHDVAPAYETPFDRSRPLWEARVYEGVGGQKQAALFFKLHHAVADGVGGNAIFAAMTDGQRDPGAEMHARVPCRKGCWPEPLPVRRQVVDALRDRIEVDVQRASAVASTLVDTLRHPVNLNHALQGFRSFLAAMRFDSHSPLKRSPGRARRLSVTDLPFDEVHTVKAALGGSMIDVILTIMTRAIGKWYAKHHISSVRELMTLVPVNLRKREEWTANVQMGNRASGIMVPLPIRITGPLAAYREVHRRMEEKRADPLSTATPAIANLMTALPRQLFTRMTEASLGTVDFIVTNVPGVLVPRYVAGAEILAAYPFAPVATSSPVSVALYGYRDRLFIGLDSDESLMPDPEAFKRMIQGSFAELRAAARGGQHRGH